MRIRHPLLATLLFLPALGQAQLPSDLQLVEIQAGFSGMTGIRAPHDGSGRLFVLEQGGQVRIFDGNATLATPFFRLCAAAASGCFVPPGGFTSGGERGLLGLAFHPLFPLDRRVFLSYTNGSGHTIVASVEASAGNANLADSGTFLQLLRVDQDFSNHNGGDIHFGADGYLHIGMGDGGDGDDPCSRSQTLRPADLDGSCTNTSSRALLGKMLRIDVDGATPAGSNNLCAASGDGSAPYAIPATNPFASDATGICAEIWATGLRNPWRFSFDRVTGDMWIGDVGQSAREEISFEPADSAGGRNYGWRCMEGNRVNFTTAPYCDDADLVATFVPPRIDYVRGGGRCSITGGYRYRGPAPSLDGLYFFGDLCEGVVLVAQEGGGGSWSFVSWTPTFGNIRTFGEDAEGNVYVGTASTVFLITGDTIDPDLVFADGFE